MPIIYALVARRSDVLAEYTLDGVDGNFATFTRVLLQKIPASDSQLSYIYDKYAFHYVVSDSLTYLCMTDQDFVRSRAFRFLDNVKSRFVASYGDRAKIAIAFSFNADFQRVLQTLMVKANDGSQDKIGQVNEEIDQARNIVIQNINQVLERNERIELLVDKADVLHEHAFKFKKQSTNLKRAMWWKNVKLMLLIFVVLIVIIYIICASACGAALDNC